MTRIVTANGETFTSTSRTRRLINRTLLAILTLIGLLILAGAVIGFIKAATSTPPAASPSPHSMTLLHRAQAANPDRTCILEWNEVQHDHEVTCASTATYNDGWVDATTALRDLYARPAATDTQADGSKVDTPAGPALIAECLDDRGLSTPEVMACLAQ